MDESGRDLGLLSGVPGARSVQESSHEPLRRSGCRSILEAEHSTESLISLDWSRARARCAGILQQCVPHALMIPLAGTMRGSGRAFSNSAASIARVEQHQTSLPTSLVRLYRASARGYGALRNSRPIDELLDDAFKVLPIDSQHARRRIGLVWRQGYSKSGRTQAADHDRCLCVEV
jgi:hypothetical protein